MEIPKYLHDALVFDGGCISLRCVGCRFYFSTHSKLLKLKIFAESVSVICGPKGVNLDMPTHCYPGLYWLGHV